MNHPRRFVASGAVALLLLGAGCSSDSISSDAGDPHLDAGQGDAGFGDAGAPPDVTDWDGILPPDRMTEWNPGLNSLGGIPSDDDSIRPAKVYLPEGDPWGGYSIDPALAGGEASEAIQAAVDAAAKEASETSRRIVLLPPGTFRLDSRSGVRMRSYVTLRGQGPRGPNATRLVKPNDTVGPVVLLGQIFLKNTQHIDLAADAAHGDRSIEVVSNPGYRPGELVFISQREDEVNVGSKWNPINQADPDVRGWYSRHDRPTGQVLEIEKVDGTTITFSTPLRLPYLTANGAQLSRFSGGEPDGPVEPTLSWMGVEDLYMRRGELGTVVFSGASYSWARNVETEESFDGGVVFSYSFRCVLRDSFIHSTGNPNPGGAGYGLDVTTYSADNLIENNIFWRFNKVMTFRASGGGNVVGYNYAEDGYGAGYPQIPEVGLNASHYATPHHELFEGNQAWNISGDSYWGNSINITFFRNHVTGRRRSIPPLTLTDEVERRFVDVPEWHFKYSFVGNVLGSEGMRPEPQSGFVYENAPPWRFDPVPLWTIGPQWDSGLEGQDARTAAETLRHGNFDYLTRKIAWDAEIERRDLPPSFYLKAKPAFFGAAVWPWVQPENPEKQVHTLPARVRFDEMYGDD